MPSVLALVWIAAPALVLAVGALLCLIIGLFYILYLRPFIDWIVRPAGGFLGRFIRWTTRPLMGFVENFVSKHVQLLLRSFATGIGPLITTLDQLTVLQQRTAGTLADMAEQTWRALWTLRHETVPRLITTALVPIRAQLGRHTTRLDTVEDLNRRVAGMLGDTLRALPWGVPGGYVTNFGTFLDRFAQLWEHYWNTTRAQLNTLLGDTLPELRRDVSDLARRLDVQIDARLDALGNRIGDLERWRENVAAPRLDALRDAVDALAAQVFEPVAGGLTALVTRVAELERQLADVVPARIAELEAGLAQLRTDLEAGIRTGLGAFAERVEAIELQVGTVIPAQIAALQLAVDAIAAEAFEGVGAGLTALTGRIVAIETWVFGELREMVELAIGRIEGIETQIRDDVLPRLRSIEGLLAPAALGVAVLAALRVAAPNLFCRNVTDVSRRICAQDEAAWAQLLGGLLVFAIALNPREVAAAGAALTGILGGVIAETVDH